MSFKGRNRNRVGRGRLVRVANKAGRFGASREYVLTYLDNSPYLFTQSQLDVASERAAKNPEDLLPRKKFFFF